MAVHKGDRVQLTPKAAATANQGNCRLRRRRAVDWAARQGTVVSCTARAVTVLWDGRRTFDQWSPAAIQPAGAG